MRLSIAAAILARIPAAGDSSHPTLQPPGRTSQQREDACQKAEPRLVGDVIRQQTKDRRNHNKEHAAKHGGNREYGGAAIRWDVAIEGIEQQRSGEAPGRGS